MHSSINFERIFLFCLVKIYCGCDDVIIIHTYMNSKILKFFREFFIFLMCYLTWQKIPQVWKLQVGLYCAGYALSPPTTILFFSHLSRKESIPMCRTLEAPTAVLLPFDEQDKFWTRRTSWTKINPVAAKATIATKPGMSTIEYECRNPTWYLKTSEPFGHRFTVIFYVILSIQNFRF